MNHYTHTLTHTLTNTETTIWIERNREANLLRKPLIKEEQPQQYQSWVIAIIKHSYVHSFLMEKHLLFPCVSMVTNYLTILHKTFWSLKFTPGFSIWLSHTLLILICYWFKMDFVFMNSGLLGTSVPNIYMTITMRVSDIITMLPSHMITSNPFRKKGRNIISQKQWKRKHD